MLPSVFFDKRKRTGWGSMILKKEKRGALKGEKKTPSREEEERKMPQHDMDFD